MGVNKRARTALSGLESACVEWIVCIYLTLPLSYAFCKRNIRGVPCAKQRASEKDALRPPGQEGVVFSVDTVDIAISVLKKLRFQG